MHLTGVRFSQSENINLFKEKTECKNARKISFFKINTFKIIGWLSYLAYTYYFHQKHDVKCLIQRDDLSDS